MFWASDGLTPDLLISATGLKLHTQFYEEWREKRVRFLLQPSRHHILLTTEREKLHLHSLHPRWPSNNVRQDALQRETKRWRQTSTAHKNHKVRRLNAPRWSATRFQEHKRYIIVFITIIVIFHFIFAQKKQTNNTFQGLDRPPPNPQTHHYSYSLLKTQLKSM